MGKYLRFIVVMVCLTGTSLGFQDQESWWNLPYPEQYQIPVGLTAPPFISVSGNRFVNENGETVIFRGVNISDPDKLVKNGKWSKGHFEVIKAWGANIVRVPVHPIAWQERGKTEYLKLLDQAVDWATELQLYLIIDWHSIGNLKTGLFQHDIYITDMQETLSFWRSIAFRYRGVATVAFYELFNEPTNYNGQLGPVTWPEWKAINEEIISVIYAHDHKVIPLVAGFNWAYDLTPVRTDPVGFEGIGYVAHPYPQKTKRPFAENWEKDFGFVADTYPVMASEFGFMAGDDPGAHIPVIDDESYGRDVIDYFNRKGISWTVWCFDPDWPPQMISDWDYTPTTQGAFFRQAMQAGNKK